MSSPDPEKRESLVLVARGVKTKGLKGELVGEILTDFPKRFDAISELTAVGPTGELKRLELERFSFQDDRVVLKFAGYDNIESAKTLVGFDFGVPEADRVQLTKDEFYDWELEGCAVETIGGSAVGTVRELLRTGGVELMFVQGKTGHETLIPLVQSIVVEVDISRKRILIDPPDGLLDL
jgi:16S rRNA processing protein RimM